MPLSKSQRGKKIKQFDQLVPLYSTTDPSGKVLDTQEQYVKLREVLTQSYQHCRNVVKYVYSSHKVSKSDTEVQILNHTHRIRDLQDAFDQLREDRATGNFFMCITDEDEVLRIYKQCLLDLQNACHDVYGLKLPASSSTTDPTSGKVLVCDTETTSPTGKVLVCDTEITDDKVREKYAELCLQFTLSIQQCLQDCIYLESITNEATQEELIGSRNQSLQNLAKCRQCFEEYKQCFEDFKSDFLDHGRHLLTVDTRSVIVEKNKQYLKELQLAHAALKLPASSHDVATGVAVNVEVLPVANKEECPEQETKGDSLSSTSTMDHTVKVLKEYDELCEQLMQNYQCLREYSYPRTIISDDEEEPDEQELIKKRVQCHEYLVKYAEFFEEFKAAFSRATEATEHTLMGDTRPVIVQEFKQRLQELQLAHVALKLPASSPDVDTGDAVNVEVLPVEETHEQETEEDSPSATSIDWSTQGMQNLNLPASSHDVDTGDAVNVEVLPVEETHEQETKEDSLSATSIDWSTHLPASSHKACVATGVSVKAKCEGDSLSTTSTIEYESDYTEEQYSTHTEDEVDEKYSTDEEVRKEVRRLEPELNTPLKLCHNKWKDKDEWVTSWKELCKFRHWTWIDVYAYFNKGQGYGGYGVILRDALAKPIIASAKFSKDGKSFFYQVFMGIKAGVELADRHKRSFLHVQCNSIMVSALFRDARECSNDKCRDTKFSNYICERCEIFFSSYIGWNRNKRLLTTLVVELRGKNIVVTNLMGKEDASHYVAKREKARMEKMIKRRAVEKKEESIIAPDDDKPGEMKPDDFPPELINILWEDAFAVSADYTALPKLAEDYAVPHFGWSSFIKKTH